MGFEVNIRDVDQILGKYNNKAIILCTDYKRFGNKFKGFSEISLGITLADKLMRHPIEKRSEILLREMDKLLLKSSHKGILVEDIDILFNPEYQFDVLKYFTNVARVKNIVVVWSGIITNDYLQYSEDGYLDYKRYLIKNYDIICVK
ncbi:BREX-3 system P-loop-containing protein BrxF [Clostridium algidicarnis]|uniref:BREX-3 system P-loop-containing protein BrxF n=1 Tax=Clostridium algidicarnis TaxID=37659 RepID=UPI001CF5836F|nr:BREX-3 system P-loop-containing protein BrxF [Clostridium algidicarnis]MCB2286903.1 BREX-3 system P-loop-containing protein BrxF [Clostridium algidicarnis]